MKNISLIIILLIGFSSCSQIPKDEALTFNDRCIDITSPVFEEINLLMNITSYRFNDKMKEVQNPTSKEEVNNQYEKTKAAIIKSSKELEKLKEVDESINLRLSIKNYLEEVNLIVKNDFKNLISDMEKEYTKEHLKKIIASIQTIMEKLKKAQNSYHSKTNEFQNKYSI